MKTSNKFTLSRIMAAPLIFVIYNLPDWINLPRENMWQIISVCVLFPVLAVTEFTDYLDGHYARKHGEVSDFGKMFDPFADVFLHLSMFTCFVLDGIMPAVCFILIIYREFSQNFLRMVAAKHGTAIAARKGGKVKTVFYVASCFLALITELLIRMNDTGIWKLDSVSGTFSVISTAFFIICVILAYISFIDYIKNFGNILKESM